MTKTILLAATALSAVALAGAANAQVITDVTVSSQSRAQQAAFNVTSGAASTFTNTVTALGTTAANVASAQYLVANESVTSVSNRTTTSGTSTTARYIGTSAAAGAQTLGLLGGNTYQITLSLSGGTGVNPRFTSSIPASAFAFLNGAGAALPAVTTATECDATDITGVTIVSGGAAGDSSVTVQFTLSTVGALNVDGCNGAADLNSSFGGVTVTHPFLVDAFGQVGVTVNTVLTVGTHTNFADTIGTAAQRTRATVVRAVNGYDFTAGGVAGAAANANAAADVAGVDQLLLGTVAPPFRTFGTNDGIATVNYGIVTQASGTAFAGLNAQALPAVTYDLRVNALNNPFGTTVDSLRPGASGATGNPVGTYTVATGGASASLSNIAGGTPTTAFINQGAAGTPTVSLATVDQGYTVTVTPATASAGLITAPAARTYLAGSLVLQGTSFRAPWMNSTVTGYNTVLRISNNGSRAIGPVELTLTSPNTATATSATVCRAANLATLGSIPANGELAINSANLTTCFGEFRRGDVSVRILDTVPAQTLAAKLRVVNPGGVVAEQSLDAFSGNAAAAAPF